MRQNSKFSGTGTSRREFLYVEDMVSVTVLVMGLHMNVQDKHTEPIQSHIKMEFSSEITFQDIELEVVKVTENKDIIEFK